MSLVLDVSVALAWILPDEEEPSASAAMAYVSRHGAVVSPIWWFELRNALLMAERRNRLTPTATAQSGRVLVGSVSPAEISSLRGK